MVQAWALAHHGFDVTLIGASPAGKQDDRTTAILMPGIAFLKSLDLWDDIAASATALATMELNDQSQNSVFDASEIDEEQFGFNISNAALKDSLLQNLKKSAYVTWLDQTVTSMTPDATGWNLSLHNGATLHADFVIGADGRNSLTRQSANIPLDEENVDQSALVTVLDAEKPHYNTSVEWYIPGGTVTLVPMEKKKLALVWCNKTELQQQRLTMPQAKLEAELNAQTGGRFGTIKIAAPLQIWPIKPFKAQQLVAHHCALVGEAAHVLPPIGAQGFNISLHDIMALTAVLQQARKLGLPSSDAIFLKRYEKKRLGEIIMRYRGVNALNTMLQSRFRLLHGLRRVSLYGIRNLSFIKKHLMLAGMKQNA